MRRDSVINKIIDTHCHLDYFKEDELSLILENAISNGIDRLISASSNLESWEKVIQISKRYSDDRLKIYYSLGLHPHDAKDFDEDAERRLLNCISIGRPVAIGEIGLDFHYNYSEKKKQIEVFEKQIQISINKSLPLIIHSRNAENEALAILDNFKNDMKLENKGVIHCYTGSLENARKFMDKGFLIGFGGIITFKNADDLRTVLIAMPVEKILFETDSPYLSPVPHRGKRNEPMFVCNVIKFASSLLCRDLEELVKITSANADRVFKLKDLD